MQKLTFKKVTIQDHLAAQLLEHKQIVEEAWEGHKKEAAAKLASALSEIEAGRRASVLIHIVAPEDHTKEIERAIKMLSMCVDEDIDLDEEDFARYVQGQWEWASRFYLSNSKYSQIAAAKVIE